MELYRTISVVCFAGLLGVVFLHYLFLRWRLRDGIKGGLKKLGRDILSRLVFVLTLLLVPQRYGPVGVLRKLCFLLALLCFAVLAVTGFYPVLIWSERLCGWLLMIHVSAAGVFIACIAFLAVTWAERHRYDLADWRRLLAAIGRGGVGEEETYSSLSVAIKTCFWVITVLALPLTLSVIFSMFKLFGTNMQEFLLEVHRYSALSFAVIGIMQLYLITLAHKRYFKKARQV